MKRSAFPTSASFKAEIEEGERGRVRMSKFDDMSSSFSGDSSMRVMS